MAAGSNRDSRNNGGNLFFAEIHALANSKYFNHLLALPASQASRNVPFGCAANHTSNGSATN